MFTNEMIDMLNASGIKASIANGSHWMAQIEHSRPKSVEDAQSLQERGLFIVGIEYAHNRVHRGCILFPPIREPFDRVVGGRVPTIMLDLHGWKDPVVKALHTVNLFPDNIAPCLGEWRCTFSVSVSYSLNSYYFWINSADKRVGQEEDKLWNALQVVLSDFIERYDDNEMREYFAYLKLPHSINEDQHDI
jgi:hypothetical protein